jgi:hypothetical protein
MLKPGSQSSSITVKGASGKMIFSEIIDFTDASRVFVGPADVLIRLLSPASKASTSDRTGKVCGHVYVTPILALFLLA